MPRTYRPYEYDYDTPYVGRTEVIENYLDKKLSSIDIDTDLIKNTIETSVHDSLGNIDCKFCSVHHHIERAKDEIIEDDHHHCGCTCNLATKEDIANAVTAINTHTDDAAVAINTHIDEKFDEIDFEQQFANLNEIVARLNN